ncbi:MAG TPA: hypothetical protein VFJ50_02450 [Gemmatimonadales bacterium]|nr:hypothetical protein [Gemmatimonadales bacterium]
MSAGVGVLVALAGLLLSGCGETFISVSSDGRIEVSVTTSGADADTDGFTISVDGRAEHRVAPGTAIVLEGLVEGRHSVLLGGVPGNCHVVGDNPQVVIVARDGRAVAMFEVSCVGAAAPQRALPHPAD